MGSQLSAQAHSQRIVLAMLQDAGGAWVSQFEVALRLYRVVDRDERLATKAVVNRLQRRGYPIKARHARWTLERPHYETSYRLEVAS